MKFNIHQKVTNRYGEPDERKVADYQKRLFALFVESPEGKTLIDEGSRLGWADTMMEYSFGYMGVTPPEMSSGDLREVVFDIFPQKVSAEPEEAPIMIRELQAFWKFLQREFQLENAAACLKVLDDRAVRTLKKEMSNPANFGMAKSFFMMGKERGFDMYTEEGLNEWMESYNAELTAGTGHRVPAPSPSPTTPTTATTNEERQDQSSQKIIRFSRKKMHKRK